MNKQFKTDAQDFLNSVQVLREVQTPGRVELAFQKSISAFFNIARDSY